jgi:hypothetical protein
MALVTVIGIYEGHPVETYITVVKSTLKFLNGYIRLIRFDEGTQHYIYEYSRVAIINVDLDMSKDISVAAKEVEDFGYDLDLAMSEWEICIEPNRLGS